MPKRFFTLNNFGRGINNVKNPRDLAVGESAECINWNVSKNGELIPRSEWHTATDGSALTLSQNTVPVHTASLNPGYGLHYFEADDPVGVRGASVRSLGSSGGNVDGTDPTGGKYALAFYDTNKIFINDIDFWVTNNVVPSSTGLPIKIIISGASNSANNGTFTVQSLLSLTSSATFDVDFFNHNCNLTNGDATVTHSGGVDATNNLIVGKRITGSGVPSGATIASITNATTFEMSANATATHTKQLTFSHIFTATAGLSGVVLDLKETSLVDESVADNTVVTFARTGFVGDFFLALGNTDDGKVDIYVDSNDNFTEDAITVLGQADTNEKSEFVYYYANNSLRVADGNHRNESTPKWYGHIERDQFLLTSGTIGTVVEPNMYEESNTLARPTACKRTGSASLNGTAEYNVDGGAGWGLCVEKSTEDGEWEGKDYEFGGTFIYDGNQESLIQEFSGGSFTHDDGKKFNINVYANTTGTSSSSSYPRRLSGGRIYIREAGSNDEWILFVDISVKDGARVHLGDEYYPWKADGDGEFRISNTVTHGDFDLKSSRPNIEDYVLLNGFSPSTKQIAFGQTGSGYKTAVVAGSRAFVANVKYDEGGVGSTSESTSFEHFGDRIMFSEIDKYDTFPAHNKLDVTKGDGEDYSCLAFYADRLLAFKQRTLQILNIASVSPAGWFLEQTVPYAGVQFPYSVCNTEYGILFANNNGAYLFDGSSVANLTEGKIADTGQTLISGVGWSNFSNAVVGYIPETKQAIFIDKALDAEDAFYYDFRYKSWYFGKDAAPNTNNAGLSSGTTYDAHISNMVNDSQGQLIVAYDTDDVDVNGAGTGKVILTYHQTAEQPHTYYRLQTPDLDFGEPGLSKKVYNMYINYRHSGSTAINDSEIEYMVNNNGTWVVLNATGSTIPQTHASQTYYNTIKIPVVGQGGSADNAINPFQSIAFRFNFDSLAEDSKFALNDIVIEYRTLRKRAA
jgi:hypothetical protein